MALSIKQGALLTGRNGFNCIKERARYDEDNIFY